MLSNPLEKKYIFQKEKPAYLLDYQKLREYVIKDYSLFYNEEIVSLVKEKVLSLREGSAWIEHKTGRKLSHVGLKKIIDNERLGE